MRILVDTNVLLRVAQPVHPHHLAAVRAIETLRARGHELCIVPQVIYEYWVVYTRPPEDNGLGMTPAEAVADVAVIKRLFTLLRDERAVFAAWEDLVAAYEVRGRNAHDARLVAAMIRHGLSHLLTFNPLDFSRFAAITVLTPAQVLQATG